LDVYPVWKLQFHSYNQFSLDKKFGLLIGGSK
jgi:hypothetical protein